MMTSQLNEMSLVGVGAVLQPTAQLTPARPLPKVVNSLRNTDRNFTSSSVESTPSLERHEIRAKCLCKCATALGYSFADNQSSDSVNGENLALEEFLLQKSPPNTQHPHLRSANRQLRSKKRPRIRLKLRKSTMTSSVVEGESVIQESESYDVQSSFASCLAQITNKPDRAVQSRSKTNKSDWTTMRADGGWAWIVAIGATCVQCICTGLHLAGGSLLLAIYQYIYDLEANRPPGEF